MCIPWVLTRQTKTLKPSGTVIRCKGEWNGAGESLKLINGNTRTHMCVCLFEKCRAMEIEDWLTCTCSLPSMQVALTWTKNKLKTRIGASVVCQASRP